MDSALSRGGGFLGHGHGPESAQKKKSVWSGNSKTGGALAAEGRKRLTKAISILGTKDRRWLNFFPGRLEIILRARSSTLGIGTTRARSLCAGSELVLVISLWGIDLVRMMKYA